MLPARYSSDGETLEDQKGDFEERYLDSIVLDFLKKSLSVLCHLGCLSNKRTKTLPRALERASPSVAAHYIRPPSMCGVFPLQLQGAWCEIKPPRRRRNFHCP